MRSYTCCAVCCSMGKAAAQCGQVSKAASTTRSGSGCSVRPTPGRLLRGSLGPAGRSGFCPFDGGSEELSGVLRGRSRAASRASRSALRASSSAIRANAACNCPTKGSSDRMRASFSATVSLLRSISGGTQSLNRVARDHVNHLFARAQPQRVRRYPGEQLRPLSYVYGVLIIKFKLRKRKRIDFVKINALSLFI